MSPDTFWVKSNSHCLSLHEQAYLLYYSFECRCFHLSSLSSLLLVPTEVLARNNRLKHLLNISDLFDDLVAASKGEVRAKITTALELEPEELEDIKAGLSKPCPHLLKRFVSTCGGSTAESALLAAEELLKPGENLLVEQTVSVIA